MSPMVRVAIGVPTTGSLKMQTVLSLFGVVFGTPGMTSHVVINAGCYVHENREQIVEEALSKDCTHVFFVDSDMAFGPDTLRRLLDQRVPIVGATYHYRRLPLENTVKIMGPDGNPMALPADQMPTQPFEAYAVGAGCFLVERQVFQTVPRPWFSFDHTEQGLITGEDVWFCKRARASGFPVWADPTLGVRHIGDYGY